MASYPVYEIFCSIQGEGANAGKAALFVRLAGCNVGCEWCDSKQAQTTANAPVMSASEIIASCKYHNRCSEPLPVVITGGEPCQYDLSVLADELHKDGHSVWLETSGTHSIRGFFDWICLSPKQHKLPLHESLERADEIKIVVACGEDLKFAEEVSLSNDIDDKKLFLQPEWDSRERIVPLLIEYIKAHPRWRLSLQIHKYIGVE